MQPIATKTPIRALVVDDEPLARAGLRELLAAEGDVEIAGECGDGLAALSFLNREKIDLLFLDAQMPELDGFETLAAVANAPLPAVIFVTAYDEYALRAFEVHAVDYLLKPLNPERFRAALVHAREQIQARREHALPPNLAALLASRLKPLERVLIKNGGRYLVVRTHEVDWISAEADYACLHVQDKKHLLRETLSALEQKLDPQKFLRVHRSTIVNLDRIQAMESLSRRAGADLEKRRARDRKPKLSRETGAVFSEHVVAEKPQTGKMILPCDRCLRLLLSKPFFYLMSRPEIRRQGNVINAPTFSLQRRCEH